MDLSVEILNDLVEQGYEGSDLVAKFRDIKSQMPGAVDRLVQAEGVRIEGSLDDYLDKLPEEIYFKSEEHEAQMSRLLDKLGNDSLEYRVFAYIVAATYKADQILKVIDDEGYIDVDEVYDVIGVYSGSERCMIRFGLQCFNGGIDDIKLGDVMRSLDSDNTRVIKQAIDMRY